MLRPIVVLLFLTLHLVPVLAADTKSANPQVVVDTSKGAITIELLASESPVSTANFLAYVKAKFYDGTIFHRVIPGFMIQGGGFTPDLTQKDTRPPITNEANNGLRNVRGTVAMARRHEPDSASSQFFINLAENNFLDHQGESMDGWGYAVFARVVAGMEVVDTIAATPTTALGMMSDVPSEPVIIKTVKLIDAPQ